MSSTTVVVENSVLSYFGFEIGVFTIVSILSSFFVLKQIKGNFKNLEHFFASKKWPFLNSDSGFIHSSRILTVITICLMIMPLVSLILWGIMVLVVQNRYEMSNVAGVSIFLVGFSVIFFALAVLYIKWSYFKIKLISVIFAAVACILYFAFQLYALLEAETPSFLGLSAVFLSINAIIMVLITSMVYSSNTGSILDIFDRLTPSTNKEDAIDTKYNKLTVEEQFEKLLIDPEYEVTEKEILKYVTIISSRKDFSSSVLSGGLHTVFRKRSVLFKRIFLLCLYLVSVGVLVAYAIIVDNYLPEDKLGWVTLVAVITTDVITLFASQLNISNGGPSTLTLLIVGMRCFLFGFGGTYWFLGYCSLYLLLGVVIGWKTVDRYFPIEIDYSKAKQTAPLYKRIIKEPLFTYAIVNVVFIIVVAVVASVTSLNIPRGVFPVFGEYYPLWVFGIACILISLTFLAIMVTFRLHQRRLKGIKDKFKFPLIKREFSSYLVFAYFTYLFAALCGILWYVIVEDIFVLLTALIIPPVLLADYMFYLNFKKNDYRFIADIKDQNTKAKAFMEGQARAKLLKSQQTAKITGKEDIEAVELKEDALRDDGVPEYLNFTSSAGKKKFVINEDWRESMNFFKAFFKRKLLYSDYANIFSILFILAALITYAVVINATASNYKLRGFTVAVTLFVFTTILMPMEGYFGTLQTPNLIQILLLILGVGGNYGYGIAVTLSQHDSIKGENDAIVTVIYWFFFLPTVLMTGIGLYALKQQKWKKSLLATILMSVSFVHWIVLGVFFVLVDILAAGIVTWGILFLLAGALGVLYIYRKNNNSFPRKVVLSAVYGGILTLSAVFIVSLCMDSFNDFVGFSITYLAVLTCFIIYVVRQLISNVANKATSPVFYSPWVFPIYKYDPNINALKKDNALGYMTFGLIFFFWIWTIAVSIWIDPVSLGISLGCLCEVVAAVYFMYMTSDSTTMLSEALKREDLFGKTVKKAWLQARNVYMTSKNVTKASDILNFSEYEKETNTLIAFIEETKTNVRKQDEKQQVQQVKPDPESLKKKPESTELKQLYAKLAEKVKATNGAFKDEVRVLIHFELMVLLGIQQAVTKEKTTILTFINTKKVELEARGLKFAFGPENLSVDAKYKLVMDKYDRLSEEQQKIFDSVKDSYLDQVKQEKIGASEKMKAEEEAKKQREKALSQKLEQNKKIMQDMSSVPLKDMPDCVQKYERIIKEYGPAKKKYEDSAFPANTNSLGENLASLVDKWERPTGLTLIGNNDTNTDPRQGSIGDCYFVSALSVAGKQNIEKALLTDKVQQRPDIGAYIVRFFFMGEPVEVIVDDLFPKDGQGEWSFCKSDSNDKLWPMIFEKAYAKLHGNYQKIVAGKVSYALSELTGGYPEEIKLSTAQKNVDSFWQKIIKYKENGYLLGAGTPENPMGDAAISSEGIIQGHAYAVLDLKEYEDEKLIKLRNPHGQGGAEWNGDWGDNSIKWTEKAKKILKPENKEDGMFWMSLQDFVYEFKALYVCRIFDQKLWKTVPTIEGEWSGESAAGLPNKKNPSADLSKNPHYGIKVNRRCSIFIALTQEDRIDMFRGKLPIMFMVQKNGGKRTTSASADLLAGNSGAPTDLITVSAEVALDVPTYPYTFSLMVASANSGAEGEGRFKLDIQCTDDFSIIELK